MQRKGTLDYLIERLAERPLKRLDAPVLAALRLGCTSCCISGGLPTMPWWRTRSSWRRVAEWSGRPCADRRWLTVRGSVNAVLRRATREGKALLAALEDGTPEAAALKHSHPEWIARLWWEQLGAEDARALLAFDNEPPELALRVNTLVAEPASVAAELEAASGRWASTATRASLRRSCSRALGRARLAAVALRRGAGAVARRDAAGASAGPPTG